MSETATNPAPADATPAPAPEPAPAPAATAPPAPTPNSLPKPAEKTLTVEQVNSLIVERLGKERAKWEKEHAAKPADPTVEEKIAAIEARATAAEKAAVDAIVARVAVNAYSPELVGKAVDLTDLGPADAAEIATRVQTFLDANPYLVKQPETPKANVTPTPGVTSPDNGPKLLSEAELDALTVDDLADEKKLELYIKSRQALRG